MEPTTETVLVQKIEALERTVSRLQTELHEARESSIHNMVGQLRLHEAVLLYVGPDVTTFVEQLEQEYGNDTASRIASNLFNLHTAPVSQYTRDAMSRAINHGMGRWRS